MKVLLASRNAVSRWKKLPRQHQNQHLIIFFIISLVLCATAVFYSGAQTDGAKMELAKQQKKNKTSSAAPTLSGDISAGTTIDELNTSLAALQKALNEARAREAHLHTRLAPNNDLQAQQTLKSAITALAYDNDMILEQLDDVGLSKEEREAPPNEARWGKLARNAYQRPLLNFKARASYRGLMHFLDGLKQLPFMVAPVRFDIEVKYEKDASGVLKQWLFVSMDLSL